MKLIVNDPTKISTEKDLVWTNEVGYVVEVPCTPGRVIRAYSYHYEKEFRTVMEACKFAANIVNGHQEFLKGLNVGEKVTVK